MGRKAQVVIIGDYVVRAKGTDSKNKFDELMGQIMPVFENWLLYLDTS
jgi:hypothetical protein